MSESSSHCEFTLERGGARWFLLVASLTPLTVHGRPTGTKMQQYTGEGAGWGWNNATERQSTAAAPVTSTAIQIHPEQQRINQYILAEMAKLKGDNKRLNDEVLRLKVTVDSRLLIVLFVHRPRARAQ